MSEKFGLAVITYPASNQHTVYNPNNNLHLHTVTEIPESLPAAFRYKKLTYLGC